MGSLSTGSHLPVFQDVERCFASQPGLRLSTILDSSAVGSAAFTAALEVREAALGVATLASQTLHRLFAIYRQHTSQDLRRSIIWHRPSLRASEKAALLPRYVIQKTITVKFAHDLVLCSSLGDQIWPKPLLRQIAQVLGLSRNVADHLCINPRDYPPELAYGVLEGMVSPFLHPHRASSLAAVVVRSCPDAWNDPYKEVAISLSPCESLLVRLPLFRMFLQAYAEGVSHVRWIELAV